MYGYTQNEGFVFEEFKKSILNNNNLKIFGNGNQIRSFCHINDAQSIIYKLMINKSNWNSIYNIGNPNNIISINKLAHKFIELSNKNLKIEHINKRCEDIEVRIPNINKIKNIYNFKYNINDIIMDVLYGR